MNSGTMMTNSHDDSSDPHTLPSDLRKGPFLSTSATLSPSPPLSFSTVIEDDHSRINAVAIKLGRSLAHSLKPTSSPTSAKQLQEIRRTQLEMLQELTWRLVRHDISEDLIMRPAFAQYLGKEGEEMGEHDRQDHEHARVQLISYYEVFEKLPINVESLSKQDRAEFAALANRFKNLLTELAEHMKVESGMQIPRLEGMLGKEESEWLARRYLRTYVLEPNLTVRGSKVWSGGVGEYVRCEREHFWQIWRQLESEGDGKRDRKL